MLKIIRPVAVNESVVASGTKKNSREYFKSWYSNNKDRLSAKKAKRYQEDAAYRESIKTRSRNKRQSNKTS